MFGPITEKPHDANLQRLKKTLVMCTLSVNLTGTTTGCASVVVLSDAVEKTNHVGAFDFMRDTRLD